MGFGAPELTNLVDVPTNWPKLVPGGATVPPKIVEIDSREAVLVAGKAIYGWWTDDGSPIVSANADGLIFQPTDAEPSDKEVFTEALAYGDYYDNGWHRMIYGNRAQDGLYAVEVTPVANSYTASLSWFSDIRSDLNAPVLFRWNVWYLDDPLVAILGRDGADYNAARSADTLYVWEMDGTPWLNDPVPTGVRPGAFGAVPSFNGRVSADGWRSLAVHVDQDLYGSSTLIQTTRHGGLVAWDEQSRSLGMLADPLWSRTVQGTGGYTLSPPAVGCVKSSSAPLIVFTNSRAAGSVDPTVYIYSIDGNEVATLSDPDWEFYNSESNDPPPRPVLVCEGGDAATIVVGGGGGSGANGTYAYAFRYEEQPDDWNVTEMVDAFPRPSRGVWGNGEGWAEPVVAQVNGEGGLDVLLPTRTKSVVSWDLGLGQPRPGWPLILGDAPMTPAVSGERLYVAAGGTLHAWDLRNESTGAAWTQWTQYGRGPMAVGNAIGDNMAFLPVIACQYGPRPARSDTAVLRASIRPGGREVLLEYTVSAGRRYVLEAFDVVGRRIARLAEGMEGDNEIKQTTWKPRGPSGVYFLRLDNGAGTTTRRVVLVR